MVPQNIVVSEWWFVALVAVIFAYLGARRGLTVELYILGAVIIGILFADQIARFLEPWINIFYQMTLAIVRDRAFSPDKLLGALLEQPKRITNDAQRKILGSVVFGLLILIGYRMGRQRKGRKPRLTTNVLAAAVGAVNGYLVAYFLFPRHVTTVNTTVSMPSVNISNFLRVELFVPILIATLAVITIGVLGARESGGKGKK